MTLVVDKTYRVKQNFLSFKEDEVVTLYRTGYQYYYGETHFEFTNENKEPKYLVLRDTEDTDKYILRHLKEYFEEIDHA